MHTGEHTEDGLRPSGRCPRGRLSAQAKRFQRSWDASPIRQLTNNACEGLVLCFVADDVIVGAWHYPDSNKWGVPLPERRIVRSEALGYYGGEE